MTATRERLTPRQLSIYRYLVNYWGEHGTMPTTREVVAEFGFATPNAAVCHLTALLKKGWIEWRRKTPDSPARSRCVVIPELVAAARRAADELLAALEA